MRVLFVTSEVHPLAKTGGLADVSRALPIALRRHDADVRLLLPGYSSAEMGLDSPRIACRIPASLGADNAYLISGRLPDTDLPVWLIRAPSLYARPGGLYQDEGSRDWADNPRRFAYLGRVAAALATGKLLPWRADIVHANDWHAGLVPFFLSQAPGPRPATVFTIHNLAFQGNFARHAMAEAGVEERYFHPEGVEFYGQFSFMKAGLRYSDRITTVSPQYGREILTAAYGCRFEGLLRSREKDLHGILNGIDDDIWNPETDPLLARRYGPRAISGKRVCKAELQRELGLSIARENPLIGFSSRLTVQKMADVLVQAVPEIMATGAQLAIVGQGESELESKLHQFQSIWPGQLAFRLYREDLAHRLQAGSDILLAPARFEPCGLTQLYALRYGTVPIVRRTGGLADTVTDVQAALPGKDAATGFVFDEAEKGPLMAAIGRAIALYRQPLAWRRLQLAGMKKNFGWNVSASKYLSLYEGLSGLSRRAPQGYASADSGKPLQSDIRPAMDWAS